MTIGEFAILGLPRHSPVPIVAVLAFPPVLRPITNGEPVLARVSEKESPMVRPLLLLSAVCVFGISGCCRAGGLGASPGWSSPPPTPVYNAPYAVPPTNCAPPAGYIPTLPPG